MQRDSGGRLDLHGDTVSDTQFGLLLLGTRIADRATWTEIGGTYESLVATRTGPGVARRRLGHEVRGRRGNDTPNPAGTLAATSRNADAR